MWLTDEEEAMLAGQSGPGVQKAMEIVIALGQIYGAANLVPVASVQVSGVSYNNLGEAGLEFLEEWAAQGGRARVPSTLNPAGMDLEAWRELGFPEPFARRQEAVIAAYARLGITPTCTCTPYQVGHVPRFGQHLSKAESSAVSYANSVLGARTNREGGPSALAAAISGRTARFGLHLDENRRATAIVVVGCPIASEADLGALGYLVGQQLKNGVPHFRFERGGPDVLEWKTLGAAMAASGAVALFHVEGVTPEACAGLAPALDTQVLIVNDLSPGYAALDGPADEVDLVSLGCPHASLAEIERIASFLDGRQLKATLWVTTARAIRDAAQSIGLVAHIEAAGGRVVADTCMVVAPVTELGYHTLATNSAKMALYAPAHSGLSVRFAPGQCLKLLLPVGGLHPLLPAGAHGAGHHRSALTHGTAGSSNRLPTALPWCRHSHWF
jgi:predicted aconitase